MTTPFAAIPTPDLWNAHDWVRGLYPRVSKYLQDQRLDLNTGINRELVRHMALRILASELLGKYSVFWSQLAAKI